MSKAHAMAALLFQILISVILISFSNAAQISKAKYDEEMVFIDADDGFIELSMPFEFEDPEAFSITSDDSETDDIETEQSNLIENSTDMNNFTLISSNNTSTFHNPEQNIFFLIKEFLKSDFHFKKAFPTKELRDLFISCLYNSMECMPESYVQTLNAGKIVSSFNLSNCPEDSILPACLLEYIDRQPSQFLNDYCSNLPAFQRFTRSIIHFRCNDYHFWRKLIQITGITRSDLGSFVSQLSGITLYEKLRFTHEELNSATKAAFVALFISAVISSYWYLIRQHLFDASGPSSLEMFFFFLLIMRPASLCAYELFIWERLFDSIRCLFKFKNAPRTIF